MSFCGVVKHIGVGPGLAGGSGKDDLPEEAAVHGYLTPEQLDLSQAVSYDCVVERMNKKLEDAWEAFSDGVVAIDSRLKVVSFSRGAERITGYSAQDVIGRTWREVFAGDLCERLRPLTDTLRTDELFSNVRSEIERADGERIMISASITPLKDKRGGIVGAVISFRDVDEVYKLTSQCYKETMRLQAILNSIADGVFTVDNNFKITSFNPAAERITGYRASEVTGKPCRFIFQSKSCAESCCLRRTIESGENISNFEMEIIDCSGKLVPVSVSTALLVDEEGKIAGGVETFRDLSVLKDLRKELEERYSFSHMVGKNAKMQRIYHLIEVVSQTSSTVLVQGETGTGKDLIARAIHYNSPRRNGPFVKVSCAALPETLLESELFGHKRGAFTGAIKDKPGRFSIADGGTIFLDEVGEIPVGVQAKLLRVLEEQEFEPLGGTNSVKVDVRIIAATNRDLQEAMKEKKFREDLYYRLNVITISIPPLNDRSDDIPLLIGHFIEKYNRKMKKRISAVSQEGMDVLLDYAWPGNVRQLEHAIEHAFIHCRKDVIRVEHLPEEMKKARTERVGELPTRPPSLREMEKQVILRVLEENAWNRKKTARTLGISRTTLWRKMKELKIEDRPD